MKKTHIPISFVTLFLAILFLTSTIWIRQRFGAVSLDSLLFHLRHGLIDVPTKFYLSYLKRIGISLALAFTLTAVAVRIARARQKPWIGYTTFGLSISFLFFAFLFAFTQFEGANYLTETWKENTFIEAEYIPISSDITFPQNKRNVIIVVMESMEKTFFAVGPSQQSLIPYLQETAKQELSCTLLQEKNLAWTTASVGGLLVGVPLYIPRKNNYSPSNNSFLPGADSILELFDANNYTIAYISGSSATFAGLKNIFTTHSQNSLIYDLSFFCKKGLSQSNQWGIKDHDLYRESKEILANLHKKNEPFLAVIQTIDTHSHAETYGDYPEPYNDERDAFLAADYMIADFLQWIKQQDFYQNTTILIVGDHHYMNDFLSKTPIPKQRDIYNTFINTIYDSTTSIQNRQATMLDMGPSLLEAIGVVLPNGGLALGRSIFNPSTQTLVEQYGITQLTENLSGKSVFYNQFFFSKKDPSNQ